MKKIILIIAGLVVLGALSDVLIQFFITSKVNEMIEHYDKVLVEYQKEGKYTAAYYELNRTFNRIASFGKYNTKQISRTGDELNERVESLLPKLDKALPEGIENDWSSTEELRERYNSFFGKRIATLNRDRVAKAQVELINEVRGYNDAPEQLPEGPANAILRKPDNISSTGTAAKRITPKEARLRQEQAQDRALEMMKKATGTE